MLPAKGPGARFQRQLFVLLLPYLVGVLVLFGLPLLLTLGLAFFTYDGLSRPVWSGLFNLNELIREPLFRVALSNSLTFVFLAIPLRLMVALLLAILMSDRSWQLFSPRLAHKKSQPGKIQPFRTTALYRTAVYFPTLVPELAWALLWLWILNPFYGPINQLLRLAGLPAPAWLVNPQTALPAIVFMSIFTIGEAFVVLLAALKSIPSTLYEAAWVDGSRAWQTFRWIALPLLQPWLILLLVRDLILSFQTTFTPAYMMTGGGPYYATLFLPLLIFEEAFDRLRFGVASAMVLVMILITGLLLLLLYGVLQNWGDVEGGLEE